MHPETRYKLCKFCKLCKNHARDTPLWGVYIPHFDQISVKISVLWVLYPNHCNDGGEIWHPSTPNFTPIGATCCPCRAKNLKISLWVT